MEGYPGSSSNLNRTLPLPVATECGGRVRGAARREGASNDRAAANAILSCLRALRNRPRHAPVWSGRRRVPPEAIIPNLWKKSGSRARPAPRSPAPNPDVRKSMGKPSALRRSRPAGGLLRPESPVRGSDRGLMPGPSHDPRPESGPRSRCEEIRGKAHGPGMVQAGGAAASSTQRPCLGAQGARGRGAAQG